MASAPAGWRAAAPAFSLLRSILRLHRERLPPPMRAMGDTFVLSEFRRALRHEMSEEQRRMFALEWQRYAAMLGGTADQQAAAAAAAQPAQAAAGAGASQQFEQQSLGSVTAAIAAGSADMTEQLLQHLSPDQRRQLVKLQQEAYAVGAEMLGKGGASGKDGGSTEA